MLVQFRFKNFKSFRDEAVLDLSAAKMTEFSERVVSIGGERLLRTAAIYGANASGKSNVYEALLYMSVYVMDSFNYGDDREGFAQYRPIPFLLDSTSADEGSLFEVYFMLPGDSKGKMYHYGLCVNHEGVTEEWLNTKRKTAKEYRFAFYRNEKEGKRELDLSGLPKSGRENVRAALDSRTLIVSLGAKLKVEVCKMVRDWFLVNEFSNFGNPRVNARLSQRVPNGFIEDKAVQQRVVAYFASFDSSIKDFRVEKLPPDETVQGECYRIDALHKKFDCDDIAAIPLEWESAGTLKMFALYPELQSVLAHGSVFVIDELNARLHPLLVRNFLLLFLNPKINVHNAQLIFTTHDTWQLSNRLLRRDEIWFTEKDARGTSTLYSLADIADEDGARVRKDVSYEKNYLLGKYGAIPTLRDMNVLEEV
jgi:putative abortive infection protein